METNNLESGLNYWKLQLKNVKTDVEREIILKRIHKIESQNSIQSEINDETAMSKNNSSADLKLMQISEDEIKSMTNMLNGLLEDRSKMVAKIEKYKFDELKSDLVELDSKITNLKSKLDSCMPSLQSEIIKLLKVFSERFDGGLWAQESFVICKLFPSINNSSEQEKVKIARKQIIQAVENKIIKRKFHPEFLDEHLISLVSEDLPSRFN